MTGKEYLRRYGEAKRLANQLKREYDEELDMIGAIGSSVGDGLPKGRTKSSKVEAQVERMLKKAEQWRDAELEAIRIRQETFDVIWKIPGDKGSVLYERYVLLNSWEQVADHLGFSMRHVFNLHRQALRDVEDCIELQ